MDYSQSIQKLWSELELCVDKHTHLPAHTDVCKSQIVVKGIVGCNSTHCWALTIALD